MATKLETRELCSSFSFRTDVSGQPVVTIFKGYTS